jgi:S-DNA-T family DNA segregation ATPase FtsK/SpoIIIE
MGNRLKNRRAKSAPDPDRLKEEKIEEVELEAIVRDDRSRKIAGAFLLLLSFFLFTAFSSYLFTWREDQDKVAATGWSILLPNELEIENLLGSFGAFVSHLFIYSGFGVASFLFCTFFFVCGVNLLTGRRLFSVARNLRHVLVGTVLLSTLAAYLMRGSPFPWGGAAGELAESWLSGFLGTLGAGMLLGFCILSYVIWQFNPSFRLPSLKGGTASETSVDRERESGVDGQEAEVPLPTAEPEPVKTGRNRVKEGSAIVVIPEEPETSEEPAFELLQKPAEPSAASISQAAPDVQTTPVAATKGLGASQTKAETVPPPDDPPLEIKTHKEEEGERPSKADALAPYDPILDLRDYKYPSLDLLEHHSAEKVVTDSTELETNKNQILNTLRNYDIAIQKIFATVGPTVTLYEIVPAAGVRISRIKNLEDDIALSLSALGIRIIAPIPGKGTIGIEVPNVKKSVVGMKSVLASDRFQNNNFALPIALGKKIDNDLFIVDLATMPHLLMAGATGQGKSVGINAVLVSLLYKKHPSQLKLVLVDPKKVELSLYKSIEKHFLAKLPGEEEAIITDTRKVVHTLNALCIEMDNRYDLLKEASCRNIREYNEKFVARKLNPEKGHQFLPFIVLVIDEFADLIMTAGKEIEMPIARLAQLARAVGIHLIIATQRPSVNIITGTIKANFPSRIAFKVSSKIDSRTILDAGGAEQLIGRGDMLVSHNGEVTRLQCVFVDTPEVERVVAGIGKQRGYPSAFLLPEYIDEKELEGKEFDLQNRDPLFEDASRLIVQTQIGSTSLLQRRMKLGYNRAGRLMDQLEAAGIVGPSQGSKPRDVLFKTEYDLDQFLDGLK